MAGGVQTGQTITLGRQDNEQPKTADTAPRNEPQPAPDNTG